MTKVKLTDEDIERLKENGSVTTLELTQDQPPTDTVKVEYADFECDEGDHKYEYSIDRVKGFTMWVSRQCSVCDRAQMAEVDIEGTLWFKDDGEDSNTDLVL